jgi:hypothetical protein
MKKLGLILLRELVPLPCWMLYQESLGFLTLQIPRYLAMCVQAFRIVILYFILSHYLQFFISVSFQVVIENVKLFFTSVVRKSYSEELSGVC